MRGFEGMNVAMRAKNPSIKTLISVGGWNFNDCSASPADTVGQGSATCELFSELAASEEKTQVFAQKVIAFCRKWGFDGFDLDWEYPVVAGHNSNTKPFQDVTRDYENYILLLKRLKAAFAEESPSEPLLLTAAVGVGKSTVETAYNIPEMNKYLDLINLMTYDMHGAWETRTGCNAPLHATEEDTAFAGYPLSVSWAVDYWLQHGASPEKLTMGIGTYGRGFALAQAAESGFLAPAAGASAAAASTKEAGYMAYYEIAALIQEGKAEEHYDEDRACPYIVTQDGEWVGYDNVRSVKAKAAWARSKGLRGTMVWALDLDDFDGRYSAGVDYPLIHAIAEGWSEGSSTRALWASPAKLSGARSLRR
jgi:chitinase